MSKFKNKYNDEYINDISGKSKDGIIYVGDWYVFENSPEIVKKAKVWVTVLSILCGILFVIAGFLDAQASFTFYVFMPYVITFLPIVYSISDSFKLLSYGKKMTHKQYDKSVVNLKYTSLANIILLTLSLIGNIIMYILAFFSESVKITNLYQDIIFTFCIVAVIILNICIFNLYKKLKCVVENNEN